jgi:hypothetical protein
MKCGPVEEGGDSSKVERFHLEDEEAVLDEVRQEVVEEYANSLRELIGRMRKRLH